MSTPTHRPALAAEVEEGRLLGVLVAGEQVVVTRIDGQLYALAGVCTHQYADLHNARFKGDAIV